MKKILFAVAIVCTLAVVCQADFIYNTNDMVWATQNGGVVTLNPAAGSGPDVTVTFTCSTAYGLGDGVQGITDTMVGIGYAYNGGSCTEPVVTFAFSQDVKDVILSIHDIDSFESLRSVSPLPDSLSGVNGDLYISGDNVLASDYNVHGDLMYDTILANQTLSFRFRDSASDMGLVNLQFSIVPEPCSLVLLGLGGLALRYRKR